MDIFVIGIIWAAATFFLFGEIVGIRMSCLNRLNFSFFENLWFYGFFGLCYITDLGKIIILFVGLLGWVLHILFGVSTAAVILVYLGCSINLLAYFFAKWYISKNEFFSTAISFIPVIFLVIFGKFFSIEFINSLGVVWFGLIVGIGFLAALIRTVSGKKVSGKKIANQSVGAFKPEAYPVNKKVVFLGIDGCDWKLFNRFLKQEKLPTFKKIIDKGVLGKLTSCYPTDSPLIWNSIFTGKIPAEHGITFWYKTKFPFLPPIPSELIYPDFARAGKIVKRLINRKVVKRIPFSVEDRKAKAIWNILTDYNKTSVNIGWLFSWPAEKINGVQVSWYMYPFEEAAEDNMKRVESSNLARRVYPEQLLKEFEKLIIRPSDLDSQELANICFPTENIDPARKFSDKLSPWDYAKDKTFLKIAHNLLDRNEKFDFFSLYLYGIDAVCHTYWPFAREATNHEKYKQQVLSVSDSVKFKQESESFDQCILKYYQYLDREVGRLIDRLGNDYSLVIVSDHGFDFDGTAHANAPDGVFMASGPQIRKAECLENISVYDILPTLLTLLGLPQAKDMPGKVIKEIFTDEFLNKFPIRFIDRYQKIGKQLQDDVVELDEATRKGIEERLKSLGYID